MSSSCHDAGGSRLNYSTDEQAMAAEEQDSRLLNLPAELRIKISSYHFESYSKSQLIHNDHYCPLACNSKCGLKPPSALQTCRLIREEASPMYYGTRAFLLTPESSRGNPVVDVLAPWLLSLGLEIQSMIQTIVLAQHPPKNHHYYSQHHRLVSADAVEGFGIDLPKSALITKLLVKSCCDKIPTLDAMCNPSHWVCYPEGNGEEKVLFDQIHGGEDNDLLWARKIRVWVAKVESEGIRRS